MKRVFRHPPEAKTGRRYWRSLEEFAQTPGFREKLEREFPQGAAEFDGDEISRRGFMKLMGASVALAGIGLTGCRRPELHVVPYSKGVEWQIPGQPLHYATAMPRRAGAFPLIATTYNGRPTKLEGNPNVPGFNGATDLFGQAAILDLYDPDRSKVVLKARDRGKNYDEGSIEDAWEELFIVRNAYLKAGGAGAGRAGRAGPPRRPGRGCAPCSSSSSAQALWAEYDPWAHQAPGGAPRGTTWRTRTSSFHSTAIFLGVSDGDDAPSIAQFAKGRRRLGKTQETMSRLYVVEGRFSITGGMADHRLRMPASEIGAVATLLGSKLGGGAAATALRYSIIPTSTRGVSAMARDLQSATGRARWCCAAASSRPRCTRRSRRSTRRWGMAAPAPSRPACGRCPCRRRWATWPSRSAQGGGQDAAGPRRQPGLQRAGGVGPRRSPRPGRAGHPPRPARG